MSRRPDRPPIFCLEIEEPGTRVECPNRIHDYPLPDSDGAAHDVAQRRLRRGWTNPKCPDCGLHDWRPGPRPINDVKDCVTTTKETS